MPFRHLGHREASGGEQGPGCAIDALAVLQRAGRMMGDPTPLHRTAGLWPALLRAGRPRSGKLESQLGDYLGDVSGEPRDASRLLRVMRVGAEEKTVILDHRAATRGVDDNRVEPAGN